jgi:hypothetical protein
MQTIATQYESPDFKSTSRRAKSWSIKRDSVLRTPLFYDYLDIDNKVDLERLKAWCHSNWLATIRKALLHRNIMQYHVCCNSFSRRNFCRSSGHPEDQTFELHRVTAFRSIETDEDLFRWLVTTVKENDKNGRKTLFPTINLKHVELETQDNQSDDRESVFSLAKRCLELEKEIKLHKKVLRDLEADNSRLLWSTKTWHSKYEELLDQKDTSLDIYATPVKSKLSNDFMFQNS